MALCIQNLANTDRIDGLGGAGRVGSGCGWGRDMVTCASGGVVVEIVGAQIRWFAFAWGAIVEEGILETPDIEAAGSPE